MLSKNTKNTSQIQMISIEQLVPQDHLLRKIEKEVDFSFIYDLVEDKYSHETGRPSIDPVTLIKIPLIQYMYGIKSMRQTIKEIEVNVAYRWFLGLDFYDDVPHFSTFGKNYKRRFEGTDLFEQIFTNILMQCMSRNAVSTDEVFIDATHIKAHANRKKSKNILVAKKAARYYDEALKEEIANDRKQHGKRPLKDKDDNDDIGGGAGTSGSSEKKEKKESTTDPESGWFHKGEHKEVFAYSVEAACDKNGWVLGYTVHPGNEHDSITFPYLYEKLKKSFTLDKLVLDAGYKTPAIAKMLMDDGYIPVFPYKRPMGKKGFMKKNEFTYDEYYDCYICPENRVLSYRTTTREGYREYRSKGDICRSCPRLCECTENSKYEKTVVRHIWEDYIEKCEDIRHNNGMKELYGRRKETIERLFGTAKEHHGMRYTNQIGKEKMAMKVGMTFTCLNIKKLINLIDKRDRKEEGDTLFSNIFDKIYHCIKTIGIIAETV